MPLAARQALGPPHHADGPEAGFLVGPDRRVVVRSRVDSEPVVTAIVDEVARRYGRVREALERQGLDAALVAGTEYTGFEGQVTYLSGFQIVHRYAYVLLPLEVAPSIVRTWAAEEPSPHQAHFATLGISARRIPLRAAAMMRRASRASLPA